MRKNSWLNCFISYHRILKEHHCHSKGLKSYLLLILLNIFQNQWPILGRTEIRLYLCASPNVPPALRRMQICESRLNRAIPEHLDYIRIRRGATTIFLLNDFNRPDLANECPKVLETFII